MCIASIISFSCINYCRMIMSIIRLGKIQQNLSFKNNWLIEQLKLQSQ